ncbi:glutamate receptor 4-like [Mizuhopecten yessoensis]|uniref:glutamate receptor 4-like n=1 Tax=Mizuhopecten yessoensis TaxID=6573 RepID=UPI000B458247|nr:glutamate receptor 4-like [Mizuhopecten yessoensis]
MSSECVPPSLLSREKHSKSSGTCKSQNKFKQGNTSVAGMVGGNRLPWNWLRLGLFLALFTQCLAKKLECMPASSDQKRYTFNVGVLSSQPGHSFQSFMTAHIKNNETAVKNCFESPSVVNMDIAQDLKIPDSGWTKIKNRMNIQVIDQANLSSEHGLTVVIGPFYTNMAMILQMNGIPYVVTDYKGFDWIDSNRVTDSVQWHSVVEMRPAAAEINLAIVDICRAHNWTSVVVVLPDNPRENQECKDLVNQMIQSHISPIPYALSLGNTAKTSEQTQDVLRNAQMLEQRVVLTCSPRDEKDKLIETVLHEAMTFGLLEDDQNVFILLDTSMYLEPLKEMNMYRKGLYAARCRLYAFRYTLNKVNLTSSQEATITDAAELVNRAQTRYLQMSDGYFDPDFSKKDFLEALRQVTFDSPMTGHVQFNDEGKRVNYTLLLVNHGGMGLFHKVGEWNPNGSSVQDRLRLFPSSRGIDDDQGSIFDNVLKVVVVIEEPFVIRREGRNGHSYEGNDRYEGFTIDILKELAKVLQLKYEIYESPNNVYGSENANGSWNGMVEEVLSGRANLGMGAISITSSREKVIDFSLGVISTGVNMLIKKPKEAKNIFQFMEPFSLFLWLAIVGASIIVSIILFVLDYTNPERQFTVKETLWFSIGTLLMRGTDFSPRPTSQRIITAGFTFFVLITVTTYTANMAAFLTTTNLEQPVTSLEELAERSDIECGTIDKSATMKFLQDGSKSVYREIWKKIRQSDHGLVQNSTVGRQRVEQGHYAFIFDYLINLYSEKNYCETKMVGIPVRLQEHGIVMPAGASFKTRINIGLVQLNERNFIQDMQKKWWDNKRKCDNGKSGRSSTQVEFSISHMAGVFIVGGFGMACSVAFFLFKKFYVLARNDEEKDKMPESVLLDSSQKIPGDML